MNTVLIDAIQSWNSPQALNPCNIDRRKRVFRQALRLLSYDQLKQARTTHHRRQHEALKQSLQALSVWTNERRRDYLKRIQEAEFNPLATSSRHNCTGIDWTAYHRPSTNGRGWVLIAPDEPCNNWYTEDPILVKILKNKFCK